MAFINANTPRTASIVSYKMVRSVVTSMETVWSWKQAHATRKRLEKLSDHQLDDIGLIRSEIPDVARR